MEFDKMILGERIAYSTDSDITGLNNNVLGVGGSGSGKTWSLGIPKMLETRSSNAIVTVQKRMMIDMCKPMLQARGYNVHILDLVDPGKSDVSYDPLAYVNSHMDITFLAESIMKANPRKERSTADPYWDDAAVSGLSAEIACTMMTKDNCTFADVLALHDSLEFDEHGGQIKTSLDSQFDFIAEKDPSCFAVSCWKSVRRLPIRTASCVFGTMNVAIDSIFSPELRKMIATKPAVDFKKLASEKTVLFIYTSAVNPALHCFVNMFYAQAFKQLFEFAERQPDGKLPIPIDMLCDDFATGGRILNFPEYISIFREKRISVTLLIQSLAQLSAMYGEDSATAIVDNCDTLVYMGGMDLKTARAFSERLNAPLEDVLYMPIGQEIVFRRGQKPIITKRYNLFENEQYQTIRKEYEERIAQERGEDSNGIAR